MRVPASRLGGSLALPKITLPKITLPIGFTLIELLVVIAIVAVLIALLLPGVQLAREAARRTQCKNKLMQIGVALNNYLMAHEVLPPGSQNDTGPIESKENGGYHMGWLTQILPYLEQQNIYAKIDFTRSAYDQTNSPVRQQPIGVLRCPTDPHALTGTNPLASFTSYCGVHNDFEAPINVDQNGVLFLNSSVGYEEIRDGSSNTMFVMETQVGPPAYLGWMTGTRASLRNAVIAKPVTTASSNAAAGTKAEFVYETHASVNYSNAAALMQQIANASPDVEPVGGGSSLHAGGYHILLGDGSVRFLSQHINVKTLRNLAHRSDGELTDDF